MPISLRRRATVYNITPYSPIVAINAARPPKNPDSVAINRSRINDSVTCFRIVANWSTIDGLIWATAAATSDVTVVSGAFDRRTTCMNGDMSLGSPCAGGK